jgi:hypothetical protein
MNDRLTSVAFIKQISSDLQNIDAVEQLLSPAVYSACLQDFIRMRERWLQLLKPLQHD